MTLAKDLIDVCNSVDETGPISKEGALKFVFKFPKTGSFTANFLDGKSTTFDEVEKLKSAGKYAFVGKGGRVFQTWDSKPSREAAHDVLQRVKGPRTRLEGKDVDEAELLDPKTFGEVGDAWAKFERVVASALRKMKSGSEQKKASKLMNKITDLADDFMTEIGTVE
jgi:hypothetical protein